MELKIRDEEVELILQDLMQLHGYDFTSYSQASLKRRLNRLLLLDRFPSFAEMRYRIQSDKDYLRRVVEEITVNVTEMFRDPSFFQMLRTEIFPRLAAKPFIRVWHAGCSTGEEVYSVAIILKELKLLHKSLLYATDLNPDVVQKASRGFFPLGAMKQHSENYIQAGGKEEFSKYYTAKYNHVVFDEDLRKRMIFSTHNLVSDSSFNEFQIILCRNVFIYFDKVLQDRVLRLFNDSLEPLGYIGLGSKETLKFSDIGKRYKQQGREKIWQKVQ